MSWSGAVAGYVTALEAAGRSDGTVRLHLHYLAQLRALHARPWVVTTAQLRELLASRSWRPETRRSCRGVMRGFYRWGHAEGLVDVDPSARLEAVPVPDGVPRPAPEDVVAALLAEPDARLWAMGALAATCGLRRAEIARVLPDRDLVGDVLTVHGKGGKVRVVPVLDQRLLWRLRTTRGYLFPSPLGGHLTAGHVGKLLADALPGDWTAHTLRHRMATRAYHGTGDLLAVQKLLGHSRPETTQRYVLLAETRLRAALGAALVA